MGGMSEVVRLRGSSEPVRHPGNPDPDVVHRLEELLEMARAGELNGIAYALHYFDDASVSQYIGELSIKTVGALFSCATRLSRQVDDNNG